MTLLLLVAVEIIRLSPAEAEAARREGEQRTVEMYAREDAATAAKHHDRRLFGGGGVGTRPLAYGHAPLGDIGQSDFVYTPGSIGRNRYRDN